MPCRRRRRPTPPPVLRSPRLRDEASPSSRFTSGTLHVRPDKEAEFLGLLMPVLDAMRHETTFINAVLHRDPDDPTRFMLYETWADLDDVVQVQTHREYRKTYLDRLPDLLREERQIQVWHPLRGDFVFTARGGTSGAGIET